VCVALERSDGSARVVVADAGIGIPPEHIPHVFERFYRVDPARGQESGGTGLGLAIGRSIAEAHGGQLQIESTISQGTRATLTLPVPSSAASETGDQRAPGRDGDRANGSL
jgi:signal transduction histidine kinase